MLAATFADDPGPAGTLVHERHPRGGGRQRLRPPGHPALARPLPRHHRRCGARTVVNISAKARGSRSTTPSCSPSVPATCTRWPPPWPVMSPSVTAPRRAHGRTGLPWGHEPDPRPHCLRLDPRPWFGAGAAGTLNSSTASHGTSPVPRAVSVAHRPGHPAVDLRPPHRLVAPHGNPNLRFDAPQARPPEPCVAAQRRHAIPLTTPRRKPA